MDCSMPPFPLLHYLPEFAQTLVHWVDDAIQPSHPLLPTSPPVLSIFPTTGSFPVSQLFTSGCQSIGPSASASVLFKNVQGWFPLGMTCLISLLSKGLPRVFSSTINQKCQFKCQFFGSQPLYGPTFPFYGKKNITLTIWIFVSKAMSLLFNMLSRFVVAFLPRSKCYPLGEWCGILVSILPSTASLPPPSFMSYCGAEEAGGREAFV